MRYWVIVGSHISADEAQRQAQQINSSSQAIHAFVGAKVPSNEYFPVIVGGFVPYYDANELMSEALKLDAVQEAHLSSGVNRKR